MYCTCILYCSDSSVRHLDLQNCQLLDIHPGAFRDISDIYTFNLTIDKFIDIWIDGKDIYRYIEIHVLAYRRIDG